MTIGEFEDVYINDGGTGDVADCGVVKFEEDEQSAYWTILKRGSGYSTPDNLVFTYYDGSSWHQLIDLDPDDDYVKLNLGKLQFYSDVTLYRDAPNTLKTPNEFVCSGFTADSIDTDGPVIISADAQNYAVMDIMNATFGWDVGSLTENAANGQNYVKVSLANASLFQVDDMVAVSDENGYNNFDKQLVVTGVSNDTIYFSSNLTSNYTIADNACISHWVPTGFTESGTETPALVLNDNLSSAGKMFAITVTEDYPNREPLFVFDRGTIIQKDLSVGGQVGVNQGAVFFGHGLQHGMEPPKIVLQDYPSGFDTLHIFGLVGLDQVLANIKCSNAFADKIQINPVADNPVLEFRTDDAERIFLGHNGTNTYLSSRSGDLYLGSSDTNTTIVEGDLEVTGTISTGTQKGNNTTDANGDCTVNFGESFDSAPLVFVQSRDSSGRGVRFDVTSKSTSSFTVKATVLPADHKHKIGQALATVNWTMGIDNATGAHKHGFDGVAAVDLAHSHGNHQHGFGAGNEAAAVDLGH
ncbi:MAG: hypothetical protein ACOWW1_11025, partial [archaeon]